MTDTTDLTNRLRERAADAGYPKSVLYNEAADEIERRGDLNQTTAAWLRLSAAILAIVQNHVLAIKYNPALTDEDVALGNTQEFQDGWNACLEMVTIDYIERLVKAHNETAQVFAGLADPK